MSLIILKQLQDLKLQDLSQKKINYNNLEKLLERLKVSSLSPQHIKDIQNIRQHLEKIQGLNTATFNIVAKKLQKINESKKRHDSISERLGNSKIALDRIRSLVNDCDKSISERSHKYTNKKQVGGVIQQAQKLTNQEFEKKIIEKIEGKQGNKSSNSSILTSPNQLNSLNTTLQKSQNIIQNTIQKKPIISLLSNNTKLTNDQQKLNADFKKLMTDGQAINRIMMGGNRGRKSKQARNKTNKHKNTRNTKTRKSTKNTRNTKARKPTN